MMVSPSLRGSSNPLCSYLRSLLSSSFNTTTNNLLIRTTSRSFFTSPSRSVTSEEIPRFAVIGSGPAGFYTTEAILKGHQSARVDIFERLPFPFGLVRYGVAPDHPEVKIVDEKFSQVAQDPRVQFHGNVDVGKDISMDELRNRFHGVILAYGADLDRKLNVPGEDLKGVYSARNFVGFYNSHPHFQHFTFDLNHKTVVILGQGNVALDVARVLLRPSSELQSTDMNCHALDLLQHKNEVKEVHIVGRRGPVQAAFTTKELRELISIPDCHVVIQPEDLVLNPASEEELIKERSRKRQFELLAKVFKEANDSKTSVSKKIYLDFFRNPVAFLGNEEHKVTAVQFEKTKLEGPAGSQSAVGTGGLTQTNCGVVFRSIGYKSVSIPGIPFDSKRGIVPNLAGRVVEASPSPSSSPSHQVPGLYVSGWLKRGPSGIIGTNKWDAQETVDYLLEDLKAGKLVSPSRTYELLGLKEKKVVKFEGWKHIDQEEQKRGKEKGKVREKVRNVDEALTLVPH